MKILSFFIVQILAFLIITSYSIGQSTLNVAGGGKMKITSGTSVQSQNLDIGSSSQLVNRGDLTVDGVLANEAGTPGYLQKADANGQGSLMNNSTGVMATVEQYLVSERWHLVTSPVSPASTEAYWDIYLKDWEEQFSSWYYIVDPTFWPSLYPTEGYSVWADDDLTGTTTINLEGELITGDAGFNYLSYSPEASQYGWNLIGNPYPSAVEWNTDWFIWNISGWALFYENGTYTGWNPWLPEGEQSYNGRTDGWMATNQGFWVRAFDTDPFISSPQNARAHTSDPFYKNQQNDNVQGIHLIASANGYTDETTVLFFEEGTEFFDGLYELGKMFNVDEAPNIYTTLPSGEKLAVNILPENWIEQSEQSSIPVYFEARTDMVCSLTATGIDSFDPSTPILLEDTKEDYIQNLRDNPTYTFNGGIDDQPDRFILHFITPNAVNSNKTDALAFAYAYQSDIYIKLPPHTIGMLTVFNTAGQEVDHFMVSGQLTKKHMRQEGIYFVRLLTDDHLSTTKIYIQ